MRIVLIRTTLVVASLIFASGILATSVFRAITPNYVFPQKLHPDANNVRSVIKEPVDYELVYPGILPGHKLWQIKVLRDKVWLFVTTDHAKRADLLILFADKRINASYMLLKDKNAGAAVPTALKAEKYLEEAVMEERLARERGVNTNILLQKLALSSLKHREVLEEMYIMAPEEARPILVETLNYPKRVYDQIKMRMIELNVLYPPSPFDI